MISACRGSAAASSQTAASRSSRSSRTGSASAAKDHLRQRQSAAVAAKRCEPHSAKQQTSGQENRALIAGSSREHSVVENKASCRHHSPARSVRPASGTGTGRRSTERSGDKGGHHHALLIAVCARRHAILGLIGAAHQSRRVQCVAPDTSCQSGPHCLAGPSWHDSPRPAWGSGAMLPDRVPRRRASGAVSSGAARSMVRTSARKGVWPHALYIGTCGCHHPRSWSGGC